MIDQKSILIVTKQGRTLDGLQALLRTLTGVEVIGQVENGTTALEMISQNRPDLLLLVTNLPHDEAWVILDGLRDAPLPRCLVLTDTITQKKRAEMLGADDVLLSGFSAAELFESISSLMSLERDGGE